MSNAMAGVRAVAKRVVERAAVGANLTSLALRARRDEVLILGYHNIVPDGEAIVGDRSLHLPQRSFAAQLDALLRTHDVLPLAELLSVERRAGDRPVAAITFDDGYRGAMTAGVEELSRRGVPATVFIPPAFVGGSTFWWDALATVDPAFREHALTVCRGDDVAVRAEAARRGIATQDVPEHARCVTVEELQRAARVLSVGSHSWSHANLAALDEQTLGSEMERPLAWLRANVATTIPWLAYPYGRSSPSAERAAERAGYAGSLLISGGWTARQPSSRQAVPRLDVPGEVSIEGFQLRVAGLLGG